MQLVCKNLYFRYPDNGPVVLDHLSFTIQGSGFHAVFGPSGVGKTSLARIISSGITEYQGSIVCKDTHTILYSYNMERLPGWADIGRVLQEITPAGREPLLQELLTIFSLDTLLDSRFPQLSLGQQNRVNLVRYLVQDFDLLILDESLANVDEQLRQSILLYLKQRFPNKMFLSISHNLMEIATFCQQILVLSTHQQEKKNHLVRGLDLQQEPDQALVVNRKKLDAVMLEIMNVC